MFDLVVSGVTVLSMDPVIGDIENGWIAVTGARICAVGSGKPGPAKQEIRLPGGIALPGFVNTHMHETLTRGLCEDLPLDRWLSEVCFPLDAVYLPEHMRAASLMNQLEMIRGGITTFLDIYRYPGEAAEVALRSGLRAVFAPQVIDSSPKSGETLENTLELFDAYHGASGGRISVWFGVHAPYSCEPGTYQRARALANERGTGLHTHVAETRWEVEYAMSRWGRTPVAALLELGAADGLTLFAHCVHVDQADIRLLAERGVHVSYNPTSNMKLASGTAPVPAMLDSGVNVGLGTDSNLSNNNLDFFEEMRTGACLQKLMTGDASCLPVRKMLEMATVDGAACLGLSGKIGSITPGKRADIILVRTDAPHMLPRIRGKRSNRLESLVYSASSSDVDTTIVDGRVLMLHGRPMTLDPAEVAEEADRAAKDLCARAGLG
ncbi:MAG: amidohydrolase [Bacillota bacterium]